MSEPNSASNPTPEVPKAPSFTYGDAPAAPAAGTPLPPPAYGERLPEYAAAPAYGVPAAGAAYGAPLARAPRRTWDLVLTIILLVVGFFGMLTGLGMAAAFTDPLFEEQYSEILRDQGISGSVDFGAFPMIVVISHLALYAIALVVGIVLLVKRKIAFYVPLAAGVIATIVFWGGYLGVVFSSIDVNQFR